MNENNEQDKNKLTLDPRVSAGNIIQISVVLGSIILAYAQVDKAIAVQDALINDNRTQIQEIKHQADVDRAAVERQFETVNSKLDRLYQVLLNKQAK